MCDLKLTILGRQDGVVTQLQNAVQNGMIHSNQQFNNIIFFAHDLPGREKFFKQMSHASSCPFCGKEKGDYYRNPDEPSSLTTMEEMVNNGYQYEKERKYLEDKMALNETVNWNNSTRKVTPNMLNKLPGLRCASLLLRCQRLHTRCHRLCQLGVCHAVRARRVHPLEGQRAYDVWSPTSCKCVLALPRYALYRRPPLELHGRSNSTTTPTKVRLQRLDERLRCSPNAGRH